MEKNNKDYEEGGEDLAKPMEEDEKLEDEEFREIHEQCLVLQESRWNSMRYYWEQHKNNKKRRDQLVKMMDESDALTKELLMSKFISYKDKFPDMAEIIQKSEEEDKLKAIKKKASPKFQNPDITQVGELDQGFNPFKLDDLKEALGKHSLSEFIRKP